MFKSIQWKIIAIFLLLTVSVMIVVGTFLLQNISAYYHNNFAQTMNEKVFTEDVIKNFEDAAKGEDALTRLFELLTLYSVRMEIDSFRNFYVLSPDDGAPLTGSVDAESFSAATPNLLLAMSGKLGRGVNQDAPYMDFALPLKDRGAVKYIIYICDTKEELYEITRNIFINILWALLFGLVLSAFLGFFLSRTIISPISTLQFRAEAMSEGDYGKKIEVRSRDEIGRLTVAFNEMAARVNQSYGEIAAEKNKIETILLYMTDSVIAFDAAGGIIHINPEAKKLLRNLPEQQRFDGLFKALDVDISLNHILYLEHNKTIEKNVETEGKTLKAYFAPFSLGNQKTAGVVVVFHDITEHLQLDRARREFVADVSHELRTPLTTIKSYAETILDINENDPEAQATVQFVKVIENEADRMARLVRDLLTLSQLDNARQQMRKGVFDLGALVQSIAGRMEISAKNQNHTLVCKKLSDIPPFYGDKDKIEQAVVNLLSNAFKYTPDGGLIEMTCGSYENSAFIKIRDNGIGIPKADLPRIFDRFYRVDKARSRGSGGTGLGLAIAKEIIELHGGGISIESAARKGTTVTVLMPLFYEEK